MNSLYQAAQQALEALECLYNDTEIMVIQDQHRAMKDAITALRAALAEPVQEPVATITECEACFTPDVCQLRGTCDHYAASQLRVATQPKLPAEPVEPYCYVYEYDGVFGLHREFYPLSYNGMKPSRTVPVYTTPPKFEPLTDEEMRECAQAMDAEPLAEGWPELIKFARAIERAHDITGGSDE